MGYAKEKVAYLKGLLDGINTEDQNQKKLFDAIVDVLEAIADENEIHQAMLEDIGETLDDVVEEVDELDDVICEELYGECDDDDEDYFDDDDDFVEVECSNCHNTVYFDKSMFEGEEELICPNCNSCIAPGVED